MSQDLSRISLQILIKLVYVSRERLRSTKELQIFKNPKQEDGTHCNSRKVPEIVMKFGEKKKTHRLLRPSPNVFSSPIRPPHTRLLLHSKRKKFRFETSRSLLTLEIEHSNEICPSDRKHQELPMNEQLRLALQASGGRILMVRKLYEDY